MIFLNQVLRFGDNHRDHISWKDVPERKVLEVTAHAI
jgi:hypothetical protein